MEGWQAGSILLLGAIAGLIRPLLRRLRIQGYTRGRQLQSGSLKRSQLTQGLRWGNGFLPTSAATQHFLVAGTTGSGKSQVQRMLMREPLRSIGYGTDSRALIYDAKGETVAYLNRIGVTAPIYSLNPFEKREDRPKSVAWDIGRDITCPTRALNLSCSLIKQEQGGANSYFSDAARLVVRGVITSFMRHSGYAWNLADLVYATASRQRMEAVLSRDQEGREVIEGFLGDERTGYAVASTIMSKMSYYSSVAALWQRATSRLSLREWLRDSSILLLGDNETASASLDVLNELMFRLLAEEIDLQGNSSTRRIWVWIDEARIASSILKSGKLQRLAVKGRSRGVCLVLAFQDIDGFREAAGKEIANEIIAQCGNKALLRMESDESATWASKLLGQYETIEVFRSGSTRLAGHENRSEQRVLKDSVLSSEFYEIPVTNPTNGLTGFFTTATWGAQRVRVSPDDVERVVVTAEQEQKGAIVYRPEAEQWIRPWTVVDKKRLGLEPELEMESDDTENPIRKKKLRLCREETMAEARLPKAIA